MTTRVRTRADRSVLNRYVRPESCAHYWKIDSSPGPTSRGVCKICGARRDFLNMIPEPVLPVKKEKSPQGLPRIGDIDFDEPGAVGEPILTDAR